MNLSELKSQLDAAALEYNAADKRCATLALLSLATLARDKYPDAAYILLAETDQDSSGDLWVQGVYDIEHESIADSGAFDEDPVAYHLHGGNTDTWSAFVTDVSSLGRAGDGEYLLDIDLVLSTLAE